MHPLGNSIWGGDDEKRTFQYIDRELKLVQNTLSQAQIAQGELA
jgi:hypothetical protein